MVRPCGFSLPRKGQERSAGNTRARLTLIVLSSAPLAPWSSDPSLAADMDSGCLSPSRSSPLPASDQSCRPLTLRLYPPQMLRPRRTRSFSASCSRSSPCTSLSSSARRPPGRCCASASGSGSAGSRSPASARGASSFASRGAASPCCRLFAQRAAVALVPMRRRAALGQRLPRRSPSLANSSTDARWSAPLPPAPGGSSTTTRRRRSCSAFSSAPPSRSPTARSPRSSLGATRPACPHARAQACCACSTSAASGGSRSRTAGRRASTDGRSLRGGRREGCRRGRRVRLSARVVRLCAGRQGRQRPRPRARANDHDRSWRPKPSLRASWSRTSGDDGRSGSGRRESCACAALVDRLAI